MNESELQRVYNYSIKHRVSKIYSMKGFVSIDNGLRCETDWNCFIKKITNHTTLTHLVDSQINFY